MHEVWGLAALLLGLAPIRSLSGKRESPRSSWLLGSVSKRVATYAPCTVMIVK